MPAATTTQAVKGEREQRLLEALRTHILKERQRKKEEHEAEVEEERQRKEREARERQDVMTLGETREQIHKLDLKLKELRNQKQQLFLQLKKVLNEDENRKKQQQQKDSEMFGIHALAGPPPHPQLYMPPRQQQHHPHQHQHQQLIQKGAPVGLPNQPIKRARSPSPPPQNYYKNPVYSPSPKHEELRRPGEVARVLWKQFPNAPGPLFYPATNAAPPSGQPDTRTQSIIYPQYNPPISMPPRQGGYHMEIPPQPPQPQPHPSHQQSHSQQHSSSHQQGHPQSHPSGHSQGHPQGHPPTHVPQGHPQSHSQGHPQSHSQGHPQSHSQGHPQVHPQAHPQQHPQVHQQSHPQQHQQGHPQSHSQQHSQKMESQQKPAQIYLSQVSSQNASVQPIQLKPQVTMEKLSVDRGYHVEVKLDPSQPPSHLQDGVVYTSLMTGIPMHPSAMQMPPNQPQSSKAGGSISQGYRIRDSGHPQPHMPGQPPQPQQIHYPRRLY